MPYVDPSSRERLQPIVDAYGKHLPPDVTAGELNYLMTCLSHSFVARRGLSYQSINDVRGALENCATEFYRRIAVPYEDQKIQKNGDVMELGEA